MAVKVLPDAEYLRECFSYDPETGSLTWHARPDAHFRKKRDGKAWNTAFSGSVAGAIARFRRHAYRIVTINRIQYHAHRIIWKMMTNEQIPLIDHVDSDGLNNK